MTPLIAIPAAGTSSRMRGRDKLLETVRGMPLLRRQALSALATGCPVLVTLPPRDIKRDKILANLDVSIVNVADAATGMSASLRIAAEAARDGPLLILLPDVPGVTSREIDAVLSEFRARGGDELVRGSDSEGRPGTPLALPRRVVQRLTELTGDDGGREVLEDETVHLVRFCDTRATRDLDTPEDWGEWRTDTGIAN